MVMYNDLLRLKKIRQLILEYDYKSARKSLDSYIKEYSTDYVAKFYDVKLLMCENRINKAEKEMVKLLEHIEDNDRIKKDYIYVTYIYLLMELEKYDLAMDYYKKINFGNLVEYSDNDFYKLRGIYLFLLKKNCVNTSTVSEQYFINQQIEYNRCRALEHVLDRHVFSEEFKFSYGKVINMFNDLEDIIPLSIKYPHYDGVDHYVFSYNNNGISSLLEVLTIKHSNQIITVYPVELSDKIMTEYINTLLIQKERCGKIKNRSSQIDKFNKKYNIKG